MPIEVGDLRIELFDPARHDRAGFVCGVDRLDNYLKLSAKKQQKACRIADEAGCFAIVLDVMSDGGEEAFSRRQN